MDASWVTVGTVVAAIAAVATAIAAWTAATTWKDALQNQRDDECVAAASELRSSLHRCMSAVRRKREAEIWPAWTNAWDHQTRFRSSYLVARRYHAEQLAAGIPDQIDDQFDRLLPLCQAAADGDAPDEARLREISDRVNRIIADVQKQLPAPD
jgi:hypothetical protein